MNVVFVRKATAALSQLTSLKSRLNGLAALAAVVLAYPAAASAATRVWSDSDCPSSDAISVSLLGLLAAGGPENASARVHVDAQSMRIEVVVPGEPNQQRTVPLEGGCADRAEMAAMIVAAWLDAMPVGTFSAPGIPPKERRERLESSSSADPSDDPNWEPLRRSNRTLAGLGLVGMVDELGFNPGLALNVGMPELIEDFGVVLETSLGMYRDLAVGGGTARYWRPTFALRVSSDIYRRLWVVRASLGPALGVLRVEGSGYSTNLADTTVMWGVDFGLVLARAWNKREAWVSVGGVAWPQGRKIRSLPDNSANNQVPLPAWEGRLTLGLSWEI
jgi:hypothetical protein